MPLVLKCISFSYFGADPFWGTTKSAMFHVVRGASYVCVLDEVYAVLT